MLDAVAYIHHFDIIHFDIKRKWKYCENSMIKLNRLSTKLDCEQSRLWFTTKNFEPKLRIRQY